MSKFIVKNFIFIFIFSLAWVGHSIPVQASSNILIDNIILERDGEEVKRPIPVKDFFEMAMTNIRALENKIREFGEVPVNTITVDRNLSPGDVGEEVRDLQKLLNLSAETRLAGEGPGSPGQETFYFGPLTRSAVIRFQSLNSESLDLAAEQVVVPGMVTESTRAALNTLFLR